MIPNVIRVQVVYRMWQLRNCVTSLQEYLKEREIQLTINCGNEKKQKQEK